MAHGGARPNFRRAVLLMTWSSFLVPAAGVVSAPILARALGTEGRGELAAALAPAFLILPVATLGLPEALTNLLARHPSKSRPALGWSALVSSCVGVIALVVTWSALGFLSGGDEELGKLILLSTVLTVPALVVGVMRGAAIGRQMWGEVAVERFIISVLRVALFAGLWYFDALTVWTGVLVNVLIPIVAGAVYWRLLFKPEPDETEKPFQGGTLKPLLTFGSKVWLGAVASMLLSRIGQVLMTPLSSAEDLGLYVVATTISDLPLVVALAIQGAVYGVNSKSNDASQVTKTARMTILVGALGCLVLGGSLPFWIRSLFGQEFGGALVPTLMLLVSALICIPGLMAAAGISAWGRPGLRSIGLGVAIVANVSAFILLVPAFGVIGACWTSIVSNVVLTGYMTTVASRVMGVPINDFLLVRCSDAVQFGNEMTRMARSIRGRLSRQRS